MKIFNQANTIIKEMILINEDNYLTPDKIALLSREDVDFNMPIIPETEDVPNSIQTRDEFGNIRNTVEYGYPHGGLLRNQTSIKADTIYTGTVDGKLVDVLSTVDKAWTLGTILPDSSMRPFTVKELAGY